MTKNDPNSSQFEIFHHESLEYSRKGGYFVTTKKAIIYLVVTVALTATVGYLVYQYGPRKNWVQQVFTKPENIQDLLDKSIRSIPIQNIRLPETIEPQHYKLKIQPNIEALTFTGDVSITIQAIERTKYIVLNVDELEIKNITIHQIQDAGYGTDINSGKSHSTNISTTTARTFTLVTPTIANNKPTPNTTQVQSSSEETTTNDFIERISKSQSNTHTHTSPILDSIHVISRQINKENFQYTMHLSKPLYLEKTYVLNIDFTGKIFDSLQGLHENSYLNQKGERKIIIASHLQPVYARRVFPCFDEPSMKATFEISIVHTENMTSLSNMPIKNTIDLENGWLEDHFETSPPIPPYLVAMILLDSSFFSNVTGKNNISIWAPKDHLKYVSYPLEKTEKIISYFNEYFNLSYALPKLDIVTIPTLPSTATENWGLIFFKESILLNGEDEKELFSFLAKKIAQQWFGNLISIKWWSDLWLIKGFALFKSDEAAAAINQWRSDFTLNIMQHMLAHDDFKSSTSLMNNITNVLEINALFDSEQHYKGSCLLRMLKYSLPETLFRNATQYCLKERQYKSISQSDFWNSVDNFAEEYLPNGLNTADIMNTWTSQRGYPLITITKDQNSNSINITQSKFQVGNESDNSLWIVPLNYIIENEEERKLWLTNRSITVPVTVDKWILFNIRRTGYYRVNYDSHNWNLLIKLLSEDHEVIPIENRGQLINDAFKLAENGFLDYQIPFNLTKYLQREENYMPWASALNSLEFLKQILQSTYLNGVYEEYVQDLVSPLYNKMQNNSMNHPQLRGLIIETACSVNYQPCIDWAKDLFSKWMQNSIPASYDLRQTIFCSAIRTGGKKEWDFLWNQIKLQKTNSDIQELFMSLGCARDTWLINKYMRNALRGTVLWQYVPYIWKSLAQPTSLAFGFKYLRENWDIIYHTYHDKPIILKAIVQDFLYELSTKSDLEDLTSLVSKHEKDLQSLASLIQGAVYRIKARVEWSDKYLYKVEQLLSP